MKEQKGITLITLIITIIVLLILAVVSVKIIVDGGIITKSQEATQKYTAGQEEEKINLAVTEAKLANKGGKITKANLETALNSQFGAGKYEITETSSSFEVKIAEGTGKVYSIDKTSGKIINKSDNISVSGASLDVNDFSYTTNSDGTITVTGVKVGENGLTTKEEVITATYEDYSKKDYYSDTETSMEATMKTIYKNGEKVTTMQIPSSIDGKTVSDITPTQILSNGYMQQIKFADEGLNGYNIETLIIPRNN